MAELSLPEYRAYRCVNPYREEQDPELVGTQFWNKTHRDVFHKVMMHRKNKFVPHVKSVQLRHMRTYPDYFGEAYAL